MSVVVKYKLFRFGDKDNNKKWEIDRETFMNYIKSDEFQNDLKNRTLFGCNSHQERDKFVTSKTKSVGVPADFLLAEGKISNILIDLNVEGDDVIGDLLIVDSTPSGKLLKELLKLGVDIEVSMSMYTSFSNGKYFIKRLNGVDTTVCPAFKTKMLGIKEMEVA